MRVASDDRGQVIVVGALLMTLLLAIVGLGVDISWYQFNLIRMQRAADAAALAGVVYLPGNQAGAFSAAYAEATKNGFTNGAGGVTVVPRQHAINNRMLEGTIQGPVQTYFARPARPEARSGSSIRSSAPPATARRRPFNVSGSATYGSTARFRAVSPARSIYGT